MTKEKPLVGLLRFRNEALILQDTLDHMAKFCDFIYVFDDASSDKSRDICKKHKAITDILHNDTWDSNQSRVQGRQRGQLLEYAKWRHKEANFIYMDADERIHFDFKAWDGLSAVIMRLFDARMTDEDQEPYKQGQKLKGFRKYFDPTVREIPFIFNNNAFYTGVACERYPKIVGQPVIISGIVEHYGKALSKQHWQDTCAYYAKYLPEYSKKWEERKKESGLAPRKDLLALNTILKKYKNYEKK